MRIDMWKKGIKSDIRDRYYTKHDCLKVYFFRTASLADGSVIYNVFFVESKSLQEEGMKAVA